MFADTPIRCHRLEVTKERMGGLLLLAVLVAPITTQILIAQNHNEGDDQTVRNLVMTIAITVIAVYIIITVIILTIRWPRAIWPGLVIWSRGRTLLPPFKDFRQSLLSTMIGSGGPYFKIVISVLIRPLPVWSRLGSWTGQRWRWWRRRDAGTRMSSTRMKICPGHYLVIIWSLLIGRSLGTKMLSMRMKICPGRYLDLIWQFAGGFYKARFLNFLQATGDRKQRGQK